MLLPVLLRCSCVALAIASVLLLRCSCIALGNRPLGSCVAQEVVIKCPDIAYSLQLHGTWANAEGYAERKFKAQINLDMHEEKIKA